MRDLQKMGISGTTAVRKLRIQKLQNGHPFMINSADLPGNQCYLEYPDGKIKLVTLKKAARNFTIIRQLSAQETHDLRTRYCF